MLQFDKEYPLLYETAKANRLSKEETILLFALREIESGSKGNEFNKQNVQNTSLAVQADSMALQIQKGEFIYQKYLKGQFALLELKPNEEPMDFVTFLGQILMASEGKFKDDKWIKDIKKKIDEIEEHFGGKDGNK